LLLKLAQERFVNVERRLHGRTLELRQRTVNGRQGFSDPQFVRAVAAE
jgi:hypothetical protein